EPPLDFEAPALEPLGPPMGLRALLAHADAHAPALRVARARLGLGEAARGAASPALPGNPALAAQVGPRVLEDGRGLDFQVPVAQPVPLSRARAARREAAEGTRARLEAELEALRWRTHWEVHAAFHRALVARERRRAAAALVASQGRLLHLAQR